MKTTTKWTRSGQYKIIREILDKYPTASDFYHKCPNQELAQQISPDADRKQYVDFLQNVVVKYSATGKILAGLLTSIGLTSALMYLTHRANKNTEDTFKQKKSNLSSYDSKINAALEKQKELSAGPTLDNAASLQNQNTQNTSDPLNLNPMLSLANPQVSLPAQPVTSDELSKNIASLRAQKEAQANAIQNWHNKQLALNSKSSLKRNAYSIAGGLVGGGLLDAWDNQYKDKIEALKNG